jgi:hypothetical protein
MCGHAHHYREQHHRPYRNRPSIDPRRQFDGGEDREHRHRRQHESQVGPVIEDSVNKVRGDHEEREREQALRGAIGFQSKGAKDAEQQRRRRADQPPEITRCVRNDVGERKELVGGAIPRSERRSVPERL